MTDLSKETAEKFLSYLSNFPIRSYTAGQIVLFAGENPENIYYVVSGRVRMYDVSPKGNEVVVNVYEPGRFFPLSWALNRSPNRYFFKAEVTTELHMIPSEDALRFITENPDITLDLLRRIYQKTERLFERMVYLMSATATRRLMYEISVDCNKFGRLQKDGSYIVPVREVDLAGRSGLSRETVSREFQKLKEQGIVRLEKEGIRVFDLDELVTKVGAIP